MNKNQYWAEIYSKAKHGHILWDGNAKNPTDPALAYETSIQFVSYAQSHGMFKTNNKILDIGCGNGRFATIFCELNVSYFGIDPCKGSIDFCKDAFKDFDNIKFSFLDVYNQVFNPDSKILPENYKFPFPNNSFDDIIVYSIFTHLQNTQSAYNYSKEIKRILKPGGKLFCTWYRSPPNQITDYVGRTCYAEHDIMNMLSGLNFEHTYGGHKSEYYDQWCLLCSKPILKTMI